MVAIVQTSVPPLSITERQRAEQAEALLEQERCDRNLYSIDCGKWASIRILFDKAGEKRDRISSDRPYGG